MPWLPKRVRTQPQKRSKRRQRRSELLAEDPYKLNVTRMDSHGGWIASGTQLVQFLNHVAGAPASPRSSNPQPSASCFLSLENGRISSGAVASDVKFDLPVQITVCPVIPSTMSASQGRLRQSVRRLGPITTSFS